MTVVRNFFAGTGKAVMASAVILASGLGVSACGVKSAPAHPPGSTYPSQYPAPGTATKTGSPSAEDADRDGETRNGTATPRSPLGFPLEYPNRPSYK